jgi:two-component system LytT family sensor kinase
MMTSAAPELLHIVGYLTGASLYALLLVMVARTRGSAYRLTIGTALLGLAWNVGELTAHGLDSLNAPLARDWMAAVSYAALGFLAAVAVHSARHGQSDDDSLRNTQHVRYIALAAYVCASVAAVMQLFAAATGRSLPWSPGLVLLTIGLGILAPALLMKTRRQPHGRRAVWMTALALFAVSALHLSRFHGASENWLTELLGHQASIPLAFAILYQDYRFAFADLFLKRALTLLTLVAVVFTAWSWLAPSITAHPGSPAIGALLVMWVATGLLFPWLRRYVSAFVDRIVLKRADYSRLTDDLASALQRCATEEAVIGRSCAVLAPALSADAVTWREASLPGQLGPHEVRIVTADTPQYVLTVGRLAGGRRLLSDDTIMLERVAVLAGRRIDALRLGEERYERMLREREISTLAAEAELRALRAQINPHFLFNALTTLGYLIQHAPSRALDTLMRLTTLLRSVLRSEGEFTTLGHEQELIDCYLEIERERFEERLDARVNIPASLATVAIPSLIIQPLVENAIKHGIAHARGGGRVLVSARLASDDGTRHLHIVVRNTGAPLKDRSPAPGSGIGLQNVERRLRCYYGDDATLTLTRDDNGDTVAELRIPTSDTMDDGAPELLEHTSS